MSILGTARGSGELPTEDAAHGHGARGSAHGVGAREQQASAHGDGARMQAEPTRQVKRSVSGESEVEDPATKKARDWKTTMQSLREEIEAAMQKGQWYRSHNLQHMNVADLIEELFLVLAGMPGDKKLYNKITKWLEREFLSRRVYPFLEHFQGLFRRF